MRLLLAYYILLMRNNRLYFSRTRYIIACQHIITRWFVSLVMLMYRCHGLRVYPVCVCNTVRLPGTGQSAHVIGGSRFTRPASNSRRTITELRLLATVQQNTNVRSHFESLTVYKSTYFDYLRTSFKANVKFVVRYRGTCEKEYSTKMI